MKSDLQNLLNQIQKLSSEPNDETIGHYLALIREVMALLERGKKQLSGMAEVWANMALLEFEGELKNRMNENFLHQEVSKRRSDFGFSRTLVTTTITNVLMNL